MPDGRLVFSKLPAHTSITRPGLPARQLGTSDWEGQLPGRPTVMANWLPSKNTLRKTSESGCDAPRRTSGHRVCRERYERKTQHTRLYSHVPYQLLRVYPSMMISAE